MLQHLPMLFVLGDVEIKKRLHEVKKSHHEISESIRLLAGGFYNHTEAEWRVEEVFDLVAECGRVECEALDFRSRENAWWLHKAGDAEEKFTIAALRQCHRLRTVSRLCRAAATSAAETLAKQTRKRSENLERMREEATATLQESRRIHASTLAGLQGDLLDLCIARSFSLAPVATQFTLTDKEDEAALEETEDAISRDPEWWEAHKLRREEIRDCGYDFGVLDARVRSAPELADADALFWQAAAEEEEEEEHFT